MRYCIRTMAEGVVHEVFATDLPSANMVYLCLIGCGYASELWQGGTRLR
jgi:hypothetical protein